MAGGTRSACVACIAAVAWTSAAGQAPPADPLRALYDQHRWFELRDAIAGRKVAPLYAGAVASAFNRVRDAESSLEQTVRSARTPQEAKDAREALAVLYMRLTRTRDMLRVVDALLSADPASADARNMRDGFEPFRRMPAQTARVGHRTPFACEVAAAGVTLPARVNGQPVAWLFDSGFSQVSLSEAEALALGVTVNRANLSAGDFSAATETRTGLLDRLAIGDSELRHVPVMIFPDAHPMWSDRPPGRRGIVGLPAVVALGGIAWTRDGTCRLGANPSGEADLAAANLAFDAESPPVTRALSGGTPLYLSLDTGAQGGTQLWQQFAAALPDVVALGSKGTSGVQQIGGRREEAVVLVPDLRIRLSSLDALLPRARVFVDRPGVGAQHGNVGMDVFSQASEAAFDFRRMVLLLR